VVSASATGTGGAEGLDTLGFAFASGGGDAAVEVCAGVLGNTEPAGAAGASADFASRRGVTDGGGLRSGARDAVVGRGIDGRCFGASGAGSTAVGGSRDIHATRGMTVRGPSVWYPAITVRTRTV